MVCLAAVCVAVVVASLGSGRLAPGGWVGAVPVLCLLGAPLGLALWSPSSPSFFGSVSASCLMSSPCIIHASSSLGGACSVLLSLDFLLMKMSAHVCASATISD